MEVSRLSDLLAKAAPHIDAGAVTACQDPDIWVIEYEDEPPFFITAAGGAKGYVLSGVAAELPDKRRPELYELMLLFNDQANSSGGVRLGIDAPDGAVTVAVEFSGELDAGHLTEIINALRSCRSSWRKVVEGWRDVPEVVMPETRAGGAGVRVEGREN